MVLQNLLRTLLPSGILADAMPRGPNGTARSLHNAVVCRTTDEVSLDVARTACDQHRMALLIADPGDSLLADSVAGMVIDLNDLALSLMERVQLLEQLVKAILSYPVAVASYDLEPEMKRRLKARGVFVYRRIGPDLFNDLAKTIRTTGRSMPGIRFSVAGHA